MLLLNDMWVNQSVPKKDWNWRLLFLMAGVDNCATLVNVADFLCTLIPAANVVLHITTVQPTNFENNVFQINPRGKCTNYFKRQMGDSKKI